MSSEPRDWLDSVDLSAESWWDKLGKPVHEEPATLKPAALPVSKAARALKQSFSWRSRKPGGARREGQRSGARKVPLPEDPVDPLSIFAIFGNRWRAKGQEPSVWRTRALALIAVTMSVSRGTSIERLCGLLPGEVLALRMPRSAWKWVIKWIRLRRAVELEESDHGPWLSLGHSRGMPRMMSWAATQTLHRAGLPGWRLGQLLRTGVRGETGWGAYLPQETFAEAAGRYLPQHSDLRQLVPARTGR
jgi:hypothetical protein